MSDRVSRVLVVVPAYNAADTLGKVLADLAPHGHDVLVVDDGSADATPDVARRSGARVLRVPKNRGKGKALQQGFDLALRDGYEVVITMDADGQHAAKDLPRLLEAHHTHGAAVVLGNRMHDPGAMPLIRRLTNRFMSWLLSRRTGQRIPDSQTGYRVYAAEVLRQVRTRSERFAAESEMLLRAAARGIPIVSVPVASLYRSESSAIHPCSDTLLFLRMYRQFGKESK